MTELPPAQTNRWRAVVRVLRSPLDSLSCAIFPSSCSLCGAPLPQLTSAPVCDACWTEIRVQTGTACSRCGDSLNTPSGSGFSMLCRACRMAPPRFERAVAFGPYEGRMRQAIHALKYDRLHPVARALGKMLASAIATLADDAPTEMLVVPVPLHRSKSAQRGFNQARLLAAEALSFLHDSHPSWKLTLADSTLMRLRSTESQAGLTPRQRRLNVRGAFSVTDASKIAGKHVLVIDDILTTGATARAAAKTLADAGAVSVWVATLARAQRFSRVGQEFTLDVFEDNEPLTGTMAAAMHAKGFKPAIPEQPSF